MVQIRSLYSLTYASGRNEELLEIQWTVNDWKQTRTCSRSKRHLPVVVDTKHGNKACSQPVSQGVKCLTCV